MCDAKNNEGEQKMKTNFLISTILIIFSLSIKAQNPPIADFTCTVDTSNCDLCRINFIDLSANTPTSWIWIVNDGAPNYTIQNPSHCFHIIGIYDITLIITNSYGSDTLTEYSYVINDSTGCYCDSDSIIFGKNKININSYDISLYPNPFSNSIIIEFENNKKEKHTFTLYNATGQLVRKIDNITTGKIIIDRKNLKNGLYFFQLRNDNEIVGYGKLIIE